MTAHMQSKGKKSDFFCFQETDYMYCNFACIVPCNDAAHLVCDNPKVCAEWVNGSCLNNRSNTFHQDNAIVLQLLWIAFDDSHREIHFAPKKGHCKVVSMHILIARASLLVSTQPASSVTLRVILARRCAMKGSKGVGIGTSTAPSFMHRFAWLMNGLPYGKTTCMSNKDQISVFLKTTPKDHKNSECLTT
jgi:hypothetical protein